MSSSCRVMFVLLYTSRQKDMDKIKYKFQREIAEITSWINSPVRLCKITTWVPGIVFMNLTSGILSIVKTLMSI